MEMDVRKFELGMLQQAVRHYQGLCKHPGQKTGYNERDGEWASQCPVCGQSK